MVAANFWDVTKMILLLLRFLSSLAVFVGL